RTRSRCADVAEATDNTAGLRNPAQEILRAPPAATTCPLVAQMEVDPLKLGVTHGGGYARKLLFAFGRGAFSDVLVLFTPPTPDSTEVPGANPTQTRDGA
ncbi:unnamed protein product, partial [Ectocarpus sp. 8 AP-2014]